MSTFPVILKHALRQFKKSLWGDLGIKSCISGCCSICRNFYSKNPSNYFVELRKVVNFAVALRVEPC